MILHLKISWTYKVEALLIFNMANVRYLSGFYWSEHSGFIIAMPNNQYLVTDMRYYEQAKKLDIEVLLINEDKWKQILKNKLIGIEWDNVTLNQLKKLKKTLPESKFKTLSNIFKDERLIKNKNEQSKIKKAIEIWNKAYEDCLNCLKEWITESQFANLLEFRAKELGAEAISFDTIVAFGSNSSCPHHLTSQSKLIKWDTVLVDFGVKYQWYCSDMTRTFCFGKGSPEFNSAYDLVQKAYNAWVKALKVGTPINEVYKVANDVFVQSGMDKFFTHSLGHWVWLEVHEPPIISQKAKGRLKGWMFVTIEPWLYFEGKFGIRIEDLLFIK